MLDIARKIKSGSVNVNVELVMMFGSNANNPAAKNAYLFVKKCLAKK